MDFLLSDLGLDLQLCPPCSVDLCFVVANHHTWLLNAGNVAHPDGDVLQVQTHWSSRPSVTEKVEAVSLMHFILITYGSDILDLFK